ncbi:cobalamin biosynthesis protein [Rosistilla oblonga]|uniref:adenosylcobinamide-phosphate synthase CbiB n=1 Tax=Rosistilla oblonga TaxID=2527990 RepID=UPI00118858B8|nr:adenosylcobinamide-phosphate synthase CbiB [Rosistilla oblonga]QDV14795.1 cobalamin biosynthesis protein [Rosistilla oblonga]
MFVILIAVLLDVRWGEPPNRFHPVVWMGSLIAWAKKRCPGDCENRNGNKLRFLWGIAIVVVGSCLVGLVGWIIQVGSSRMIAGEFFQKPFAWVIVVLVQALVLKSCFGISALYRAGQSVFEALSQEDIPRARTQLAYHLVSRDVEHLSASQISAAAIESVAENTSDSIVAPLFFYVTAGLPGVLIYRFANTCDAMLGYRTTELEWLGKPAARFDDLLNLIPARITAVLMIAANNPFRREASSALKTWLRDARATASPNAGHPMSVAAGLLEVCLEKRNHYRLGWEFPPPTRADISQMLVLFRRTVWLAVILASASCQIAMFLPSRSTP